MSRHAVYVAAIIFFVVSGTTRSAAAQGEDEPHLTADCLIPALDRLPVDFTLTPRATAEPLPLVREATSLFHAETRPASLPPMYIATAALQALDAHSTLQAVGNGSREANAIVAPVIDNRAAWLTLKALAAATTIFLAEKSWRRHPRATVVVLALIIAAQTAVVVHNYRLSATGRR